MTTLKHIEEQIAAYRKNKANIGTTHSENCWSFGAKHYDCALRKIEELKRQLKIATNRGE